MAAGERLFVDLLPESWTGEPPGLPREVVEELARRAREAERQARQQAALEAQRQVPAGAGAGREPADVHALHLRAAGADRRHHRSRQGQADAEVRRAAAVRSGRREARAAEGGRRDRRRRRRRQRRGEVLRSRSRPTCAPSARIPISSSTSRRSTSRGGAPIALPQAAAAGQRSAGRRRARRRPCRPRTRRRRTPRSTPRRTPKPNRSADAEAGRAASPCAAGRKPPRSPGAGPPRASAASRAAIRTVRWRPSCAARATTCACSSRSPSRRRPRCSSAPTRCGWCSTPRPPIDVAALGNDPSRTIRSAELSRARTRRRWCGSSSNGRACQRRCRRRRLGGHASATPMQGADQAAEHRPQHRRPGPRQHHHSVRRAAQGALARRSRHRRHAAGRHRARAGARLDQDPGLRRVPRARQRARHRDPAATPTIIKAELSADKMLLARPGGLTLSEADAAEDAARRPRADLRHQLWSFDRERRFHRAAVRADPRRGRGAVHAALRAPRSISRASISRAQMFAEAKAVLDVAIADDRPTAENPTALVLRAIANIMLGRVDAALKELAQSRWSATSTTRSSGARWPMRGRASGRRRATRSAMSRRDGRAADRVAAHRAEGRAARRDRGRRFRRRRQPPQRFRDDRRVAARSSRRSRC